MILKEIEGKKLLADVGLNIPNSILVTTKTDLKSKRIKDLTYPVYVKAQVLHGNREKNGLVEQVKEAKDLTAVIKQILKKDDEYNQRVESVLIEESIEFIDMYYISIGYSTQTRTLVINFSLEGGTGMDDRGSSITVIPFNLSTPLKSFKPAPKLLDTVNKLIEVFSKNDASLVEINPLVGVNKDFYCLDSKIELEDVARFRHKEWEEFGPRTQISKPPTKIEERAHKVSAMDHRGVAGESFFEFPGGNIGVMASGGGASTLAMDALLSEGLSPANYTEYSGNPTREKVKALTDVVLSMKGLEALYVVGSNANFTDIYETLSGVVGGLLESKYPKGFKILIRRGGPRWEEAFDMVEERLLEREFNIKLFGPDFPIVKTAEELAKMFK